MFVDVIEYNSDFPGGFTRNIPVSQIKKFYVPEEDLVYVVNNKHIGEVWPAKYKTLVGDGELFTLWDIEAKKTSFYIKPSRHSVMIDVRYATATHIYDDSTYIQSYFSDMSLEEFKKICDPSKCVEKDEPIENRWDILDIREK